MISWRITKSKMNKTNQYNIAPVIVALFVIVMFAALLLLNAAAGLQ